MPACKGCKWKKAAILKFKMAAVTGQISRGTDPQNYDPLIIMDLAMYQVSCFYQKVHNHFTYPPCYPNTFHIGRNGFVYRAKSGAKSKLVPDYGPGYRMLLPGFTQSPNLAR